MRPIIERRRLRNNHLNDFFHREARKKVLVTSATDFLGLATCRKLVPAGHEVRDLARSQAKDRILEEAGIIPIIEDLDDPGPAFQQAGSPQVILNLAPPWFEGAAAAQPCPRRGAAGPCCQACPVS